MCFSKSQRLPLLSGDGFFQLILELEGRHRRGIIGRSVILQELIHGLKGLIVPVKNLEIGHGRRCLGPAGVNMGKIRKSASSDQEARARAPASAGRN